MGTFEGPPEITGKWAVPRDNVNLQISGGWLRTQDGGIASISSVQRFRMHQVDPDNVLIVADLSNTFKGIAVAGPMKRTYAINRLDELWAWLTGADDGDPNGQ